MSAVHHHIERDARVAPATWFDPAACRAADLEAILDAGRSQPRPPLAAELMLGIPVYDEMMNVGWALCALSAHERFLNRASGTLPASQARTRS